MGDAKRDTEYLEKLQDYYARWRGLPSYNNLITVLGLSSRSAVSKVLNRLGEAGPVRVEVFDAAGRRVRTLHAGELAAGSHEFVWDGKSEQGSAVASGVYLARLSDGERPLGSRRMTMMK